MIKYVRLAEEPDLPAIGEIFADARNTLAQDGSAQWQNGTPTIRDFEEDVREKRCYVLVVDGAVAGMASLIAGPDRNYARIDDGEWKNDSDEYIAVHRVAISSRYSGLHLNDTLFSCLLTIISLKGFRHVRIDTHPKNQRMQHIADKFGFEYRGRIYIEDEETEPERRAYELDLGEGENDEEV